MRVSLNSRAFEKQLDNLIDYSLGFLDGAKAGKRLFFNNLGQGVIQALSLYIDSSARSNPSALHHVYEWTKTGSPSARLFDLSYTATGSGLSIGSTFKQSHTVQKDSSVPFYNKARVMESGMTVRIKPKRGGVLAFEQAGETVFTKKDVVVTNPGGNEVAGSFQKTFDEFFKFYFTQAFLKSSGLLDYIEKPTIYKKNFSSGLRNGKSKGYSTGFKWITEAKVGIE